MGLARGWSVLFVMAAACGRTELESSTLVGSISPLEQTVTVGDLASWQGTTNDEDAQSLIFAWRIFARPASASARLSSSGPSAQLRPDQPGEWVIELQAGDEARRSPPVFALLRVEPVAAGNDAGTRDAGLRDAGVPDAGVPDAGVPDAGVPDAGVPDAGVLDAGFDAGWAGRDFDAAELYLAGTLQEGTCYRDAIANVFAPNVASVGFDCDSFLGRAMIRPTDGRLLYLQTSANLLREYHCDVCPFLGPEDYPLDTMANDTVVPTPCPSNNWLYDFLISVEGEVLHVCNGSAAVWRDSTGNPVVTLSISNPLAALGASGWAISEDWVVNWKTNAASVVGGIPSYTRLIAARWAPPDGFFLAIETYHVGDELWRVSTSGMAQRVGAYGALPPNTAGTYRSRLDRQGRLYQTSLAMSPGILDVVVRRQVGAPSTVVYSEATSPLVKLHGEGLITGP